MLEFPCLFVVVIFGGFFCICSYCDISKNTVWGFLLVLNVCLFVRTIGRTFFLYSSYCSGVNSSPPSSSPTILIITSKSRCIFYQLTLKYEAHQDIDTNKKWTCVLWILIFKYLPYSYRKFLIICDWF